MGKYDAQLANSRQYLADAEKELAEAHVSMINAAPNVRDFVIGVKQRAADEAKSMIDIFEREG
jgi:hypothetical protein